MPIRMPSRRGALIWGLPALVLVVGLGAWGLVTWGSGTSAAAPAGQRVAPNSQAAVTGGGQAPIATSRPAPDQAAGLLRAFRAIAVPHVGKALNPGWPKTVTVLSDSVLLGLLDSLQSDMPGWKVEFRAWPALMIHIANRELTEVPKPVGSVVVVGLGYNSLWEHDRAEYSTWAAKFDSEADQLISILHRLGAKKIVWVTLRNSTASNSPPNSDTSMGLSEYAWYFPYVNERLQALVKRHPDVALADWGAVGSRPGVTYDIIHLNDAGIRLMTGTVRAAMGLPIFPPAAKR